jgi:hypothetical protein
MSIGTERGEIESYLFSPEKADFRDTSFFFIRAKRKSDAVSHPFAPRKCRQHNHFSPTPSCTLPGTPEIKNAIFEKIHVHLLDDFSTFSIEGFSLSTLSHLHARGGRFVLRRQPLLPFSPGSSGPSPAEDGVVDIAHRPRKIQEIGSPEGAYRMSLFPVGVVRTCGMEAAPTVPCCDVSADYFCRLCEQARLGKQEA